MDVPGVTGLLEDIKVAFVLPIVGFCMFWILLKVTPRSKFNALLRRLSLMFVLALFVVVLSALMFQDRAVLIALWMQNPLLYSCVYALFGVVVVSGLAVLCYSKLRPNLWRRGPDGRSN